MKMEIRRIMLSWLVYIAARIGLLLYFFLAYILLRDMFYCQELVLSYLPFQSENVELSVFKKEELYHYLSGAGPEYRNSDFILIGFEIPYQKYYDESKAILF